MPTVVVPVTVPVAVSFCDAPSTKLPPPVNLPTVTSPSFCSPRVAFAATSRGALPVELKQLPPETGTISEVLSAVPALFCTS